MPNTRVFLLRHAESATPNVFHGAESDIELSPRGHRQAAAIAEHLVAARPEVIVASAMRRAADTAQAIAAATGAPLHTEPMLHERRVGILSGQPFDTGGVWSDTVRRWSAGQTSYAHEGAESFDDIRERVLPVWARLIQEHTDRTIVIVAHGVVCKVLLLSLFPELSWSSLMSIRNVGMTELLQENTRWRLVRFNEWPHEVATLHELGS